MKRLLTAVIAASALTAAVPALAQTYLDDRASSMDQRIDNGLSDGSLTFGQASVLRSRLHDIERRQARYQDEGMAGWQSRELNRSYDRLADEITNARHDTSYRYRRLYDEDVW